MGKEKEVRKRTHAVWNDFKAFISRGSVVDLAVGVIMGGAFNAIVTAVTQILLSLCTWGVPGGISGLVTVLPAANEAQRGVNGIGQFFANSDISEMAKKYAESMNGTYAGNEASWIAQLKTLYTQHGDIWTYNQSAIIDWGSLINAVIAFFIIALTLFVIVKVYGWSKKKRAAIEAAAREEYFKHHPEERPAPAAPEVKGPTQEALLGDILVELKKLNAEKEAPKQE